MLETTSCATMRLAESPQVDCVALQSLKTLLYSVLQDRHPFSGGADANPNESTPTCAIGIVSSSIRGDPLAQVASRNPTQSGDVGGKAASRILGKRTVSCGDEGGQP